MKKIKLPTQCPSCNSTLNVSRLSCTECGTEVSGTYTLPVLAQLPEEEQEFILHFVVSGGSLKEMASVMGVSYPTVRNRLDDLIQKIKTIQSL